VKEGVRSSEVIYSPSSKDKRGRFVAGTATASLGATEISFYMSKKLYENIYIDENRITN